MVIIVFIHYTIWDIHVSKFLWIWTPITWGKVTFKFISIQVEIIEAITQFWKKNITWNEIVIYLSCYSYSEIIRNSYKAIYPRFEQIDNLFHIRSTETLSCTQFVNSFSNFGKQLGGGCKCPVMNPIVHSL